MDLEKMEVLLKLLKLGSIKKASQKLGYTQSGLHYIINSVEDELGLQILNRTSKGVSLNSKGEKLYPYLENLILVNADLIQKANELADKSQTLSISVLPCVSESILPDILKEFINENPDVPVSLQVTFEDLLSSVEFGESDASILPRYVARDYTYYHLLTTGFCAALPAALVPENMESITVDEFQKYPIIITTTNPENMVFKALVKRNLSYSIKCSVLGSSTPFAMVAKGLGVTYLSSLYESMCPPDIRIIPFEPALNYDIGIVVKPSSENIPIVQRFICIAQSFCQNSVL